MCTHALQLWPVWHQRVPCVTLSNLHGHKKQSTLGIARLPHDHHHQKEKWTHWCGDSLGWSSETLHVYSCYVQWSGNEVVDQCFSEKPYNLARQTHLVCGSIEKWTLPVLRASTHFKIRMKAPVVLMPQCCALCTTTIYTWIVQNTMTRLYSLPYALHMKIWACTCAPRHNYTRSPSSGRWFDAYHLVHGRSLVALASSSAIVNSYSCSINEIPSCIKRGLWRSIGAR